MCYSLFSMVQNLTFWGKLILLQGTKPPNLQNLQRQLFRETVKENVPPEWLAFPNFIEEQVAIKRTTQFKGTTQMRELLQIQMESIMPDL
jgi:hypothetical protein